MLYGKNICYVRTVILVIIGKTNVMLVTKYLAV